MAVCGFALGTVVGQRSNQALSAATAKCSSIFTRDVPDSFHLAIPRTGERPVVHVDKARHQHAQYRSALESIPGFEVVNLPSLDRLPDSVFVEDTVVQVDARTFYSFASRAPSRAAERGTMTTCLSEHGYSVVKASSFLDGGDVLRVGRRLLLVGISTRTDASAVEELASAVPSGTLVRAIRIPSSLHLKTVVTWVDETGANDEAETGRCPAGFFILPESEEGSLVLSQISEIFEKDLAMPLSERMVCRLGAGDAYASNTLSIVDGAGKRHLHIPSGFPDARSRIETFVDVHGNGVTETDIIELDMSEFEKANGGLTCLSVVVS